MFQTRFSKGLLQDRKLWLFRTIPQLAARSYPRDCAKRTVCLLAVRMWPRSLPALCPHTLGMVYVNSLHPQTRLMSTISTVFRKWAVVDRSCDSFTAEQITPLETLGFTACATSLKTFACLDILSPCTLYDTQSAAGTSVEQPLRSPSCWHRRGTIATELQLVQSRGGALLRYRFPRAHQSKLCTTSNRLTSGLQTTPQAAPHLVPLCSDPKLLAH